MKYADDRSPMAQQSLMPQQMWREDTYASDPRNESMLDSTVAAVLPHTNSMDLENDPRFTSSNAIEKRLAAFSGLSIVAALTAGLALEMFLHGITEGIQPISFAGVVEIIGFVAMSSILFMSLTAALVFIYQTYFTQRLMTAGSTGFELARGFYLDSVAVRWRHFAVRCLVMAFPMLLFAMGCMLYARLSQNEAGTTVGGVQIHPGGVVVLLLFTAAALALHSIASSHDNLFEQEYAKRVTHDTSRPLLSNPFWR